MTNHAANTTNDNASLGFDNMPVRFFCYSQNETGELDLTECDERMFLCLVEEGCSIKYQRHSVFFNGVRQICLTADNIDDPLSLEDIPTPSPTPTNKETKAQLHLVA